MRTRFLVLLTGALLLAVVPVPGTPADAAITPPTYVRTIGTSGHAGVYAWGAATASDGSILISDYNNYVVRRYSTSGQLLQTFSSKGTDFGQNSQPYGLAVDPNTGVIYLADTIAFRVDVFNPDGTPKSMIIPAFDGAAYVAWLSADSQGRVLMSSTTSIPEIPLPNRVFIYDADGHFVTSFGENGTGDGQLGFLRGIAAGPNDDIYVVDAGNRRVQVFDKNGTFLRKWGSAGTGNGQFSADMRGIAIDQANGWVYVTDSPLQRVQKFTLDGQWLWTANMADPDNPAGPRSLTVGQDGNVYVADYSQDLVQVFNQSGTRIAKFPDPPVPAPDGGLNQAEDVAVNRSTGNVYVSDTFNHRIQEFASDGAFIRKWGFRGVNDPNAFSYPRGVAIDQANGNVWVNNTRFGNIKAYTSSGSFVRSYGTQGTGTSNYGYARGIYVGANGRVYVPDSGNLRLKATNQFGAPYWIVPCGTYGNDLILLGCTGVTQDAAGNVYAASPQDNSVWKFSSAGTLLGKLGTATLQKPYDVAIIGSRLYVSELGANRISVLNLSGVLQGTFGSVGTGHGQFNKPMGLSVDSSGRLYVADSQNERIEVFAP